MVEETRRRLSSHKEATVVAYGHLGDGNLHLNVSVPEYSDEVLSCIEPFVYEYTAKHRGSISAEHGEHLGNPNFRVSWIQSCVANLALLLDTALITPVAIVCAPCIFKKQPNLLRGKLKSQSLSLTIID